MRKINLILAYSSILWILILLRSWLYNIFWNIARISLLIIVFSRPLADIFILTKVWPYIRKIVFIRQWLGIITGVFALAHAIGYFITIDFPLIDLFSNWIIWQPNNMIWLWMRAMIFMLPPLITSNIFSMRKLWKYRKTIQRFTYPAFVLTALHIGTAKWHIQISIIIITIYTIIRILAYKKIKIKFAFK